MVTSIPKVLESRDKNIGRGAARSARDAKIASFSKVEEPCTARRLVLSVLVFEWLWSLADMS